MKETLAISSLKPEMNAMQSSMQFNVFSYAYIINRRK